jgi:hypothetical protein
MAGLLLLRWLVELLGGPLVQRGPPLGPPLRPLPATQAQASSKCTSKLALVVSRCPLHRRRASKADAFQEALW